MKVTRKCHRAIDWVTLSIFFFQRQQPRERAKKNVGYFV